MEDNVIEEFDGKNLLNLKVKYPSEYLVYRAVRRKECFSYTKHNINATILWQTQDQMATIQIYSDKRWESSFVICYPYNLKSCKAFEHFCKTFRIPFNDFLDGRDLEKIKGEISP